MTLRKQFSMPNKVILGKEALDKLKDSVIKAHPHEACGILLSDGEEAYVKETWPMENRTDSDLRMFFEADPMELYHMELRAEKEGKKILGFYHSHPDAPAEVSLEDERFFLPGMLYLIISVDHGRAGTARCFRRETVDGEVLEIKAIVEERAQ